MPDKWAGRPVCIEFDNVADALMIVEHWEY